MTAQPPQDPYGQQDPYAQQQGYAQQGYQGYQQQYSGGYPQQAKAPFDIAKLLPIAAWVILGLYGVWYLWALIDDTFIDDFAVRMFSNLPTLGQGIALCAAVHAVAIWMQKQQSST
jgi:hypothetical protein